MTIDLSAVSAALGKANSADPTQTFTLDLAACTQFGSPFGVNQLVQDGYSSGRLSGLSVSPDGVIQGKYSNGQSRNLGQVVLAKFNNPNGLLNMGGNQWQETSASGQPLIGAPGTGSNGVLQAGAVEESNTDMTAELVNMITQQRAYQANAQTIKTQDQIMQTLVNLR
jgi:flagellar hook protein FlgE